MIIFYFMRNAVSRTNRYGDDIPHGVYMCYGAAVTASDFRSKWSQSLDQLCFPSLMGSKIEYQPYWLGLRRDVFACAGWQVTLLLWQ